MSLASSGQNAGMLEIAEIAPKHESLGHQILPNAGELVSLASSGQNAGMLEIAKIAPKRGSLGLRVLPNAGEPVSLASSGQNAGMPGAPVGGVQASHYSVAPQAANKPATHRGKVAGSCGYATHMQAYTKHTLGCMLLGHRALANARALVSLASSGQNTGMPGVPLGEVCRHRTAVWLPKQPTNPPHIRAR